jgi:hypothetical protein
MVMDPLVRNLRKNGFRISGQELGALAFADDIVCLADSIEGAKDHVGQVGRHMNKLSTKLTPHKSPSFFIPCMKKTWVVRAACLSIGETKVPGARPSSVLKYFEVNYTLPKGLESGTMIDKLVKAVIGARVLPIQPLQKFNITVEEIIPKLLYGMILRNPMIT